MRKFAKIVDEEDFIFEFEDHLFAALGHQYLDKSQRLQNLPPLLQRTLQSFEDVLEKNFAIFATE